MESALLVFSLIVIVFTLYDIFITVLSHQGAGPITDFCTNKIWALFLYLKHKKKLEKHLQYSGPLLLVGVIFNWYALLNIGWVILVSLGNFTVNKSPNAHLSLLDAFYFVGSTFTTLGLGDIKPTKFPWTLVTTWGALTASFLTSLVISYIIPILSAVVERKNIVSLVRIVGPNPREILQRAWGANYSGELDTTILNLPEKLINTSYKAHLYPVLYFFHFKGNDYTLSGSVVNLLDALLVQLTNPSRTGNIAPTKLLYLLDGIDTYVTNLSEKYFQNMKLSADHSDLIQLLQDEGCNYKEYINFDRWLVVREKLLVFAYYEAGDVSVNGGNVSMARNSDRTKFAGR